MKEAEMAGRDMAARKNAIAGMGRDGRRKGMVGKGMDGRRRMGERYYSQEERGSRKR
jgi:hypothetical protein